MKKIILAVFVSGLFLSTFATSAKHTSITGTCTVNDTDTTRKKIINDFAVNGRSISVHDTDTTKKAMLTDDVALNIVIDLPGAPAAVSDTDTTKKKMTTDITTAADSKTKIDPATLPEAVKTTLAGDEYKDWKITAAYEVKGAANYYEIELKKGDSKTTVQLDKDGKKI